LCKLSKSGLKSALLQSLLWGCFGLDEFIDGAEVHGFALWVDEEENVRANLFFDGPAAAAQWAIAASFAYSEADFVVTFRFRSGRS
jgi:hypothetical protein